MLGVLKQNLISCEAAKPLKGFMSGIEKDEFTQDIVMNEAGGVDHLADDGDLPLLRDDVGVGGDAEVVVEGVAESHRYYRPDGFSVTVEVVPETRE